MMSPKRRALTPTEAEAFDKVDGLCARLCVYLANAASLRGSLFIVSAFHGLTAHHHF
jgi:hypothetical protein